MQISAINYANGVFFDVQAMYNYSSGFNVCGLYATAIFSSLRSTEWIHSTSRRSLHK